MRQSLLLSHAVLAALCVVGIGLGGCGKSAGASGDGGPAYTTDHGLMTVPASSPLRQRMVVEPLSASVADGGLELPATVEADPARVVNVLTPVTGKVVELRVGLGDRVQKGQVLAVLASGDYDQAVSDLEKAEDAFELAKKTLERAKGVREAGGSAEKDLEAARSAYTQAKSELDRSRARRAALSGASHGHELTLTAPQAGVVTSLAVSRGGQVSDATATLMTIANIEQVFVTALVAENDVSKVSVGQDATVSLNAFPDHAIKARITRLNAQLEADSRREKVRIRLDNPGEKLLPNMYATVRLSGGAAKGVWAPQSALLMNNDQVSVLVEVKPWTFERRAVQLGDETRDAAQVVSGLTGAERIVVRGGVLLND